MKFINESGLYTLIARSDKREARKFQRWVTSEVLPSIRKTGSYNVQEQQQQSCAACVAVSIVTLDVLHQK